MAAQIQDQTKHTGCTPRTLKKKPKQNESHSINKSRAPLSSSSCSSSLGSSLSGLAGQQKKTPENKTINNLQIISIHAGCTALYTDPSICGLVSPLPSSAPVLLVHCIQSCIYIYRSFTNI